MKTQTYTLPAFWASALINDDWTGLDKYDASALESWVDEQKPGYCIDVSQETGFSKWHDASKHVLACDCLEYTFQIVE